MLSKPIELPPEVARRFAEDMRALCMHCTLVGPINGESFRAYVEQMLVPTLQPGDIVVMDNLGSA